MVTYRRAGHLSHYFSILRFATCAKYKINTEKLSMIETSEIPNPPIKEGRNCLCVSLISLYFSSFESRIDTGNFNECPMLCSLTTSYTRKMQSRSCLEGLRSKEEKNDFMGENNFNWKHTLKLPALTHHMSDTKLNSSKVDGLILYCTLKVTLITETY